jgi:hypothetical protein
MPQNGSLKKIGLIGETTLTQSRQDLLLEWKNYTGEKMSVSNMYEPNPIKNLCEPVWESVISAYLKRSKHFPYYKEVIKDFKERDEFGRSRYGVPLQPFNGRNAKSDLAQEIQDGIAYSYQAWEECREPLKKRNFWDIHLSLVTMYETLVLIEK